MTTFTFRRVHSTILILLGGFLLSSVLAEAEMVDVTITADAAPLGPGTVFGQSESSPATVRFRLDTSNPIIIPAGTQIGPFESDIIATDLYGYNGISAISASYGTKTWDGADVASSSLVGQVPCLSPFNE